MFITYRTAVNLRAFVAVRIEFLRIDAIADGCRNEGTPEQTQVKERQFTGHMTLDPVRRRAEPVRSLGAR